MYPPPAQPRQQLVGSSPRHLQSSPAPLQEKRPQPTALVNRTELRTKMQETGRLRSLQELYMDSAHFLVLNPAELSSFFVLLFGSCTVKSVERLGHEGRRGTGTAKVYQRHVGRSRGGPSVTPDASSPAILSAQGVAQGVARATTEDVGHKMHTVKNMMAKKHMH